MKTVFVAFLVSFITQLCFATQYTVTMVGTLGGNRSSANGISNSGDVVGASWPTSGSPHAFLYSNGEMLDLGTSGGTGSYATAINSVGQVVGGYYGNGERAFLYSNGSMQNLGVLGGNGPSAANGINDNAHVVGLSSTDDDPFHAFLYQDGQMRDLGTLGGNNSVAYGINHFDQVVGQSAVLDGTSRAFLYSGGEMQNLGTLGGSDSWAKGINDRGQVVGGSYTSTSPFSHAFVYYDGVMVDIGTLGFSASAESINNLGDVVGWSSSDNRFGDAFLYTGGSIVNLNDLMDPGFGWRLTEANDINDLGQIICDGINPFGDYGTFVLTPIPCPGTCALSGVSFFAYLGRRRR